LHLNVLRRTAPELGRPAKHIPGDLITELLVDEASRTIEHFLGDLDILGAKPLIDLPPHFRTDLERF
jgi:hypothetical protein